MQKRYPSKIAKEAAKILVELSAECTPINMNDVYIAATARVLDEPVLTADSSHFNQVEGVYVVDWSSF